MVEVRYIEEKKELVVSGITRDDAEGLGAYLFEKLHPSGDLVPTGVTGTYDPETGRLRILCPDSDSTSDEIYANLVSCFSGVGVDMSKGDIIAYSQFDMYLNPNVHSGDDVKELLGLHGYDIRLPGEVPEEQEVFEVNGLNVGPPAELKDLLDEQGIITL